MSNNNRHRFNNRKKKPYLDESYVPPFDAGVLGQGLDYLKISDTVTEKLTGAGITTIFEVVRREERDFYRIPTFDKRNLENMLQNFLSAYVKQEKEKAGTSYGIQSLSN